MYCLTPTQATLVPNALRIGTMWLPLESQLLIYYYEFEG